MNQKVILFFGFIGFLITSCTNTSINYTQSLLLTPNIDLFLDLESKYSHTNPLIITFSGLGSEIGSSSEADLLAIEAFQNKYPYIRVRYQTSALNLMPDSIPDVMVQPYYLSEGALALSMRKVYALDPFIQMNLNENILDLFSDKQIEFNRLNDLGKQSIYSLPIGYQAGLFLKNELFLKYLQLSESVVNITSFQDTFSLNTLFNDSINIHKINLIGKMLYSTIEIGKEPTFFISQTPLDPIPQNTVLVIDSRNWQNNHESFRLMKLFHASFNFFMYQWGILPLTVYEFDSVTPDFLTDSEVTIELMDFLKNEFDNESYYLENSGFMLKRFNPLLEKSPLNYLYTNYLKRFSKDLDLSNLVFDFSTFMSKDSDNNYLEYNPYNVYLLRSTNQTEDSLLAAWYLVDFLANEGNIYYSTIGDLMPINIKTKQTPDYLEFLENNPFIKKMQEFLDELIYTDNPKYKFTFNPPFRIQRQYDSISSRFLNNILYQNNHPEFVAIYWTQEEKLNYYFEFLKR